MTRFTRLAPLALASLVTSGALALACTTSTNGPGAPGSDGGPGADTGSVANGDAGPGGGGDGAGASGRSASISVSQALVSGTATYSVSAGFNRLGQGAGTSTCTSQTFGPCITLRCPVTDAGLPSFTSESAGTITVTGPAGGTPAVLTFDSATQRYTSAHGSAAFFKGGDTITASGAGDVVPAFAAQTVIAPNEVTFTAPACAATACPDLDRSKDMTVSWTNGGAGDVAIAIETTANTLSTNLFCSFKASDGAGTVPAAAMATLDKADGTTITALEIMYPISQKTFAVGSYTAVNFGVQGTGTEGFTKMAN